MTAYNVEMYCDGGGDSSITVEAHDLAGACKAAKASLRDWVAGGDWGDEGAIVDGWADVIDPDTGEQERIFAKVEIEPSHAVLILRACGGSHTSEFDRCCGDDPEDHDWTSEGEGGCDTNPGVWSHGGTAMSFADHCRKCGLRRTEVHYGSQRNPGQADSVAYEMPDAWCGACQDADCEHIHCESD